MVLHLWCNGFNLHSFELDSIQFWQTKNLTVTTFQMDLYPESPRHFSYKPLDLKCFSCDVLCNELIWLNIKWRSLKPKTTIPSSRIFCSALLLSVLSSKVKLKYHWADRLRCKRGWQNISLSCPQHSFWAVISIYFVTIAALNHVSCWVWRSFIPSRAGITLSFYFSDPERLLERGTRQGVTPSPQTCSTWITPKNLSGWQEMWMEFPHQTAGWGMVFVYCEGRSEDVGEGEEGTASFTPECQSWFLREDCGHRRPAFLCVHTWVCEV